MKWQILVKILPLAALFCLLKWGLHSLGWEPWAFDSLAGALFGAVTFVIAFVLGGTLSDYRSSEAAPAAIVNAIAAIQDNNLLLAAGYEDYDAKPLQKGLLKLVQALQAWLLENEDINNIEVAIDELNLLFLPLLQKNAFPLLARLQTEQSKIRLLIAQIQANRDTQFLGPAYVLLFLFVGSASLALLLIGSDRFSENLVLSSFLFSALAYLVVLIIDLDNPFEYSGKSCVDVDLSPLQQLSDRLSFPVVPTNLSALSEETT